MSFHSASEKSGKCAILGEEDADVAAKLTAGTSIQLDDKQAARLRYLYLSVVVETHSNVLDGRSTRTCSLSCAVRSILCI